MKRKCPVLPFLALFFLIGCKPEEVYFKYRILPASRWERDSALLFRLDSLPVSPAAKYAVSLEITHRASYPYKNLRLYIDQNITDTTSVTDTLELKLADEFGNRYGANVGTLYQISREYITHLQLDTSRIYLIKIRQAMQQTPLKGIEKIGVRVMAND